VRIRLPLHREVEERVREGGARGTGGEASAYLEIYFGIRSNQNLKSHTVAMCGFPFLPMCSGTPIVAVTTALYSASRYPESDSYRLMKTIHRSPSQAFTLIELLVVTAIIVILASMLIPCLAAAKVKALQASCLCNQKQFSAAFTMYVNDNTSKLPSLGLGKAFSNVGGYWQLLASAPPTWPNPTKALTDVIKSGLAANQPGVTAYLYGQSAAPRPSPTGLDVAWVAQHWVDSLNP
jgi:prepilin-type N-terminal cleavage/methylation domain-containing protein